MPINLAFPIVLGEGGNGAGGFVVGKVPADLVTTTTTTTGAPTTTTTTTSEPTTTTTTAAPTTTTTTPVPMNGLYMLGANVNGVLGNNDTVSPDISLNPAEFLRSNFAPDEIEDITAISNTGYAMALIKKDTTLWTCGNNTYGYLADTTKLHRSSFVQVGFGPGWSKVYANAAIKNDNSLWMWGYGIPLPYGQYGSRSSPVQVAGSWSSYSAYPVGFSGSSMGIKTDGTLWGIIGGTNGQFGDNSVVDRSSPVQIGTSSNWSQISINSFCSLAIKTDGTLWGSGTNAFGQLGLNDRVHRSSFVQIGSRTDWYKVFQSHVGSYALDVDGRLWAWGAQTNLFPAPSPSHRSSPVQIGAGRTWLQVVNAGNSGAFLLEGNGQVWKTPTVSTNVNTYSNALEPLGFNYGFNKIAGGTNTGNAVFGLRYDLPTTTPNPIYTSTTTTSTTTTTQAPADGLRFIGNPASGEAGNNDVVISSKTPFPLLWKDASNFGTTISTIPDVIDRTMRVVKMDGTMWCAGNNAGGEIGDGTKISKSSPVQIGSENTWQYAILNGGMKSDGSLWLWGANTYGQLGQNNSIVLNRSSPVQVAGEWIYATSNGTRNFGIKNDATLWGWGFNNGAIGDNDVVHRSSPVQIAGTWSWVSTAGTTTAVVTVAVKGDGTLWAWGVNTSGQLGQNDKIHRSSPVQVGSSNNWSTCLAINNMIWAINTNGELWACGTAASSYPGFIAKSSITQVMAEYGITWNQVVRGGAGAVFALDSNGQVWYTPGTSIASTEGYTEATLMPYQQLGYNMQFSKICPGINNNIIFGYK
jgi:alpha-tubulin suppressor-like RCC1 family protein